MTLLRLDTAGSADNDLRLFGWIPTIGIFSGVLTRTGPAYPGSYTLYVIADDSDTNADPNKRFYPFLNIRIVIVGNPDIPIFVGRIDHAELQDTTNPRQWMIIARDWLSVLADNNIGRGLWRTASHPQRNMPIPETFTYEGNYTNDYLARNLQYAFASVNEQGVTSQVTDAPLYGEFRYNIVWDLCINIVQPASLIDGLPTGLNTLNFEDPPNSKPINYSISDAGAVPILDAIRDLISADPWCAPGILVVTTPPFVDSTDIENLNFPDTAGIGGELQIDNYQNPENYDGREVIYFARGTRFSGMNASWQNASVNEVTHYIFSHTFVKEGADIFSRISQLGKGDSKEFTNNTDGGQGVVTNVMEDVWDPTNGNFHVRREITSRSQAIGGYSGYQTSSDETETVKARALHDQSYANLISGAGGASALQNQRGGLNQGTITVSGPPIGIADDGTYMNPLIPGYTAFITLPQVGLQDEEFIIDGIQYNYPEDTTVVTLSRLSHIDIRRQLGLLSNNSNQSASGLTNQWVSTWTQVDPSGRMQFQHNIGVFGSKPQLEAAWWDQQSYDQNGGILPDPKTIVPIGANQWDPTQGQFHGVYTAQNDDGTLTAYFNYWIVYSEGKGQWLSAGDFHTVVRAKVTP